jgi:TonB family protein
MVVFVAWAAGIGCSQSRQAVAPMPLSANPPAEYPAALLDSGIAGRVVLEATVAVDGLVIPGTVRVIESDHPLFEASARAALSHWRFRPAMRNGAPTEFPVRLPFEFALKVPTPQDCRAIILRADSVERQQTGMPLGRGLPRTLQPIAAVPPRAREGRPARTVAEFQVRSDSTVTGRSLRIVESTLPPDVAAAELRDVMRLWRFHPAESRGCLYPAITRFELAY